MRTGVLIFGGLLFILGLVFFFYPIAGASAAATTAGNGGTSTDIVRASATVPFQVSLALLLLGVLVLVIGLVAPGPEPTVVREERDVHVHHDRPVRKVTYERKRVERA
jgi:hypothetical protein